MIAHQSAGHGPPVVLLHAFPFDRRMWASQLDPLAASRRVVAVDLPGFGASAALSPARSIDAMAASVTALLASLAIDRASLVGLSMGGYVALAIAELAPSLVDRLVLCDTRSGADSAAAREGRAASLSLLGREGLPALVDTLLPKLLAASATVEARAKAREIMLSQPAPTVAAAIEALRDRPDRASVLDHPPFAVRCIVGEHDALTPVDEHRAMVAAAPGAALHVIEGAGHLSCIERPEAFTRALVASLVV